MADLHGSWKRTFDVYERLAKLGIDLPGHSRIEPEMIVQSDPELALRIIRTRGPQV